MAGQVLAGKITYDNHEVDENNLSISSRELDFICNISIKIEHVKGDGHSIYIAVDQGFVVKGTNNIVLKIKSTSTFKTMPYSENFYRKPASTDLIELISKLARTSMAHNAGMFCIIREDYNLDNLTPGSMPERELRDKIFNYVNRYLFN